MDNRYIITLLTCVGMLLFSYVVTDNMYLSRDNANLKGQLQDALVELKVQPELPAPLPPPCCDDCDK